MDAVEFERVSKTYAIYDTPGGRLKELLTAGRHSCHREFHALQDLSFTVRRGEVFCIAGENGSGKSTILQIVAGILAHDSGEVKVNGRVSALLELGAGFNPEFTGRDNIYLNAAILGLSKREIDLRYPQIEEFAGIGNFIREPVKTYSSGMIVRLAFAIAIHTDPEILLVDEALAVGDVAFRRRCMRKVHELRARGLTIVFVSHSVIDMKALGDRVLWLERGRAIAIGDIDEVLPEYIAAMNNKDRRYAAAESDGARRSGEYPRPATVESIPNIDHRHGNGEAEVIGIAILDEFGDRVHLMVPGSRIMVRISVRANGKISRPVCGFLLRNHLGIDFADTDTARESRPMPPLRKREIGTADFHLEVPELYPGNFSFSPWVSDGPEVCDWIDNAITVQMARGEGPVYGYIQVPCRVEHDMRAEVLEPVEYGIA